MKNFLSLLCLLCISFLPGYAQKITFTPQWTLRANLQDIMLPLRMATMLKQAWMYLSYTQLNRTVP